METDVMLTMNKNKGSRSLHKQLIWYWYNIVQFCAPDIDNAQISPIHNSLTFFFSTGVPGTDYS